MGGQYPPRPAGPGVRVYQGATVILLCLQAGMGNTGNRIMPEQRSAVCIGFAVLAMVFTTIDATAGRDEEAHEFGCGCQKHRTH